MPAERKPLQLNTAGSPARPDHCGRSDVCLLLEKARSTRLKDTTLCYKDSFFWRDCLSPSIVYGSRTFTTRHIRRLRCCWKNIVHLRQGHAYRLVHSCCGHHGAMGTGQVGHCLERARRRVSASAPEVATCANQRGLKHSTAVDTMRSVHQVPPQVRRA